MSYNSWFNGILHKPFLFCLSHDLAFSQEWVTIDSNKILSARSFGVLFVTNKQLLPSWLPSLWYAVSSLFLLYGSKVLYYLFPLRKLTHSAHFLAIKTARRRGHEARKWAIGLFPPLQANVIGSPRYRYRKVRPSLETFYFWAVLGPFQHYVDNALFLFPASAREHFVQDSAYCQPGRSIVEVWENVPSYSLNGGMLR